MEKKKFAAIAAVVLLIGTFIGLSAWRYFTVVAPQEDKENEPEAALDEEGATVDEGGGEETSKSEEEYDGEGSSEFSVLRNLKWEMANGQKYASFSDPGFAKVALVAKSTEEVGFEILAVEGSLDEPEGALMVVRLGDDYGTMRMVSKKAAGEDVFAASPDSNYEFSSSLFGESPFYDEPNRTVSIGGYERGISADLEKFKDGLDKKLESTIRDELPSVTEAVWLGSTTTTLSEDGYQLISTEYRCNDSASSVVSVLYSPTDGAISISVSGSSRAVVNEHVDLSSENVSTFDDGTVVIQNPTEEQTLAAANDSNAIVNGGDAGDSSVSIVYPGEQEGAELEA